MQNLIQSVAHGSPAKKAGIKPGDKLISINGNTITDVLDYMYFSYEEELVMEIEHQNGRRKSVRVKKDAGEDTGIEFEMYLLDKTRSCANNCIFCFVDQLPEGLRSTLYFKDDDVRLSFLTGSYITLTNMTEREVQRVIDLKISPINVSVHTTNPQLRCMMLGNRNAGKGIDIIKRFAEAGIEMNCQIVCCPGINDGEELISTMTDLAGMHPAVNSVSIVPVGLTKHREGLYDLKPFDKASARETINLVENFTDKCLEKYGSRIFFPADELFIKAGMPIPPEDYYEGYPQLENGVGLIRLLKTEFNDELSYAVEKNEKADGVPFSIVTGVSAAPVIEELLTLAKATFPNIDGRVYAVRNEFFGETVDVAGLVTGNDIIKQIKGKDIGKKVYIPERMLRQGEGIFLDDVTLEELSGELGVPVIPAGQDGASLLYAMLGGN